MLKKIKIAHLIYGLNYGGAERLLISFTTEINKEKFETMVVALYCAGPIKKELEDRGTKVVLIRQDAKFSIFDLFKLIEILKKEKIDILHTHLFLAGFWGGIAARLLRKPHITTLHGSFYVYQKPEIFQIYKELGFSSSTTIFKRATFYLRQKIIGLFPGLAVAVSMDTKENFVKYYKINPNKIIVVYNGINIDRLAKSECDKIEAKKKLGLGGQDFIFGYVSRLSLEKGVIIGVKIIEELIKKHDNIRFVIVGEGKEKDSLSQYIRDHNLDRHVHLLSPTQCPENIYYALDVFLLPSLREDLPLVLLEAMVSGLAVIAFNIGGIKEVIENGINGFMVPFANIPEMARVAEHLFLHPEIIPQISQQAKDTVIKRFSSTMMIRNYEGLYERLHGVGRAEGEDVKKFLRLEGEDPLYQKIFMRKFSLPLSRILVHTPITPNQVTFLSFLFSIAGISCLFFYDGWLLLISVLLMQIGYLLDSIDGEIARFKNLASVEGFFLDFCAHRVLLPLRLLGFSLLLWKATSLIIYPIFGIFGVFFSLYSINAIENAVIFKSALKNKVTLSFHKLDSGEERNTGLGKIYFLWTDTPVMNLISLAIIFDLVFFSGCGNLFKSFILFFYGLSFPLVKMIKFALWVKFKKTGKLYSRLTKE